MDFELNEEQRQLQESFRRLLQAECAFDKRQPLIDAGSFQLDRWRTYADMGWLALTVPEARGGLGQGPFEMCLLMEEVGRSLCVEPLWSVAVLSAQLLVALPATPVVDALLAGLMDGTQRVVVAHGEAQARGDVAHVATRAVPRGVGRWIVSGEKTLVVGGNVADRLLVSARTAGADGDADGISLFCVDPAAAGVERQAIRRVDNQWAAHLRLNEVELTDADLLCPVGSAHAALDQAHAHALLGLCAETLGLMEQALWTTRDYLKLRKQFGTTLSHFQALQHRMSDMLIELELSRSMVFRAIAHIGASPAERNAALSATKYHVGCSGRFVCGQAIQLHGGIGVTEEYIVGHYFKRMTLIDNALGGSYAHLERLAEREREGVI